MTFFRFAVREMRQRPGRTTLTLLGIVIGVAAIVSISITVDSALGFYGDMFESLAGRAELEVVARGLGAFDPAVGDSLRNVGGIREVMPVVQSPIGVLGAAGAVPATVMGIQREADSSAEELVLVDGEFLNEDSDALMPQSFARAQGIGLKDTFRVLGPTGVTELRVAGLLEARGAAAVNGGAVIFVRLRTAQRIFALGGKINSLHLILHEGASISSVQAEIHKRLPTGLTVQLPAARGLLAQDLMLGTQKALEVMSVIGLVAGAFVIFNSFRMSIGERRRSLAVLRALGTTRRQIVRLLLCEAVLLGAIGTLVGIALGLGMSQVLMRMMEEMLRVTMPAPALTVNAVILALILGPGVTLVATFASARQAARRSVLHDLVDGQAVEGKQFSRWPAVAGLACIIVSLVLIAAAVNEWWSLELILSLMPVGMVLLMVGFVLLIPPMIGPLASLLEKLFGRILRAEGRLSVRQLLRHPSRTGLTVSVLSVAVMVSVGFGNNILNSVDDTREWGRRISGIDFFVRGFMPDSGIVAAAALSESIAGDVVGLEGIRSVDKISFLPANAAGRPVMLIAKTFVRERDPLLDWLDGDRQAAVQGLLNGEVVVGTTLAQRAGLRVGDGLTLQTAHGPVELQIVGTVSEYTAGGMVVYMEWEAARKRFDLPGVHVFGILASDGMIDQAAHSLGVYCAQNDLMLETREDFRHTIDQAMAGVIGSLWTLLALGFVVASLGIVNTVTMNVLEQTHELGVLRAVAMQRGQLRRMIVLQALIMGLISLVPGLIGGVSLAYLVGLSTYPLTGLMIEFQLETGLIGYCVLGALVIATLAAWLPARRAARVSITQALQYE